PDGRAADRDGETSRAEPPALKPRAIAVFETLQSRGALFVHELAEATGLEHPEVRAAIADLVSAGVITSDGFAGLRAIVEPGARRPGPAGRWSAIVRSNHSAAAWTAATSSAALTSDTTNVHRHHTNSGADSEHAIETQARALRRRYGIVFRRVIAREANVGPWRDLARVYRRLEARGEIRGGRFVSGMSGEQFALDEAVARMRELRRTAASGRFITISAADPLNLAGIVTAGDRV